MSPDALPELDAHGGEATRLRWNALSLYVSATRKPTLLAEKSTGLSKPEYN
jgi:hypothetical protein